MQKPTMLVGHAGTKYGLQTRQPQPQAQPAGKLAAFGGDSDSDEDTVGAQIARQAARKVADSKVQEMYAAALAQDPNAFNYDEVYDNIQEQKSAPKQQDRIDRKPKYIASLLEQAQVRKREEDITYERRLLKERQKEDHMFDDTEEKFITSAYRRKLEEDKKWIESQKLKDLDDERNDVTKLGHMNNFFANLTKNVALGGSAVPAKQQQQQAPHDAGPASAAAVSQHREDLQQQQQKLEASPAAEPEQQHQHQEQDSYRDSRQDSDRSPRQRQGQQQHHPTAAEDNKQSQQQDREAAAARPFDADTEVAVAAGDAQQQQQQQQAAGTKRNNNDAAVAAARERYLARKRQQLGV